jgi:hypothetical protein
MMLLLDCLIAISLLAMTSLTVFPLFHSGYEQWQLAMHRNNGLQIAWQKLEEAKQFHVCDPMSQTVSRDGIVYQVRVLREATTHALQVEVNWYETGEKLESIHLQALDSTSYNVQ